LVKEGRAVSEEEEHLQQQAALVKEGRADQ
jgi:hypothetical protein